MKDAADDYREKMFKGRKCEKYKDVYPALWQKFKEARARGHRVDFYWLWSKGRGDLLPSNKRQVCQAWASCHYEILTGLQNPLAH